MCHCAYRSCPRPLTSTRTSTEYCNQGASKLSNTTDWAAEIARGGQITAPPSGPRIPWLRRRMIHIWGGPSRWSWGGLKLIKIVLDIATADGQLHLEGSYWIRMMEDGEMKTRLWVLRGPEEWQLWWVSDCEIVRRCRAIAARPPVVVERDAGITDAGTSSAQQVVAGCLFVGRGRLTADHWPTFVCKSPGSRAQWKFFVRKMDLDLWGYVGDQPTHWPLPALIDHQPPEGGRAQGFSRAKLHWSSSIFTRSKLWYLLGLAHRDFRY